MDELDGRIRAAVFELLDAAPDAPPFPEVEMIPAGRAPRPRPRRRAAIATVAVVVVAALTVGVVVAVSGDSGTSRVSAPDTPAPTTLVAMVNTTLVVMAKDGPVLRTLATGLDPTSVLATTPDGGQVYVDTSTAATACSPQGPLGVESIVRYPLDGSGGPGPAVPLGTDPAVSPDGRYLAFARLRQPCLTAERERIQAEDVVVRDLTTGAERVWTTHEPVTGGGDFHYYSSNISWAPDSRHLAFEWDTPGSKPVHVVDALRSGDLDTTPTIPVPDGVSWVGYLGATGKAFGIAGTDGPFGSPPGPSPSAATPLSVVAFDPGTGHVDSTLFTTAGFTVSTRTVVARAVTVDRSGNRVLLGTSFGTGTLLSWSTGDSRPHEVGPALSGTWIEPPGRR